VRVRKPRTRGRRGQGTIKERNGRYVARWSTTEGGKRSRTAKTFILRGDAEWWLSQAKRHGQAPEDLTVAEYLEGWLAGKRDVAASTRRQYTEHVRLHIVPVLGRFRLTDLRRSHVEAFVEDRSRAKSLRAKKAGTLLGPSTVGKILTTLRSALSEAVPRLIPDNPAAAVRPPRVEREPVRALTPDDARALYAALDKSWMLPIVRVLLGSGLRIGEAVALDQRDVHDGWVGLRQSKTTIRAVRLSADADAAIHEVIRLAPRRGPREPVFFSPRPRRGGMPRDRLAGSSVSHALPKLLEAAGLGRLTPHGLRHGTATLMVAAGVHMRVVAEQLGHANPALTARTYSHVAPESVATALTALDDAVRKR
jgi:integrase